MSEKIEIPDAIMFKEKKSVKLNLLRAELRAILLDECDSGRNSTSIIIDKKYYVLIDELVNAGYTAKIVTQKEGVQWDMYDVEKLKVSWDE